MERGGIRAYARYRKERGFSGATDTAVRKAIRSNRIVLNPDGTIDFAAADASWTRSSDPLGDRNRMHGSPERPAASAHTEIPPGGDTGSYIDARTRRERALAREAELKLAEREKQLLPADEVRRTAAGVAKIYAAGREGFPVRVSPKLAGRTDLAEIEAIIRAELRVVDDRIADEIKRRYQNLADGTGSTNV